jgi:EAL domain-containing protein (putative c-di-GMP-specific phosphodiesterase class I)
LEEEENYIDWIKSILRRLQIVGSGLVLEFALPSIATRLDRSIDFFDELSALGIRISLSHFPSKKSGFKALGYLNVDIIRPRSSLLNSEAWNIEDIRRITHARNIEIILPEIDAIERISNLWWRCADYIQAEFPRQARRAPGALGEDLLTLYLGAYRSDSDSCREAAIPRE